ncbi:MAG: tetratricopeptide repeat protein [Fimbriiglobus sp.]
MGLFVILTLASAVPSSDHHSEALTRFGLGVYHARQNRPATALAEFRQAAKLEPNSVELMREQLAISIKFGRNATAIRLAKAILVKAPEDIATAHTLGQLYHDGRNSAEAAQVFLTTAKRPECSPRRRLSLYEDAFTAAKAAKDPKSQAEAARGILETLASNKAELLGGNKLENEAAYARQLARRHDQLGEALVQLQDYAGAEKAFQQGIPLAQDWQHAGILVAQKEYAKARPLLERWLPKYGQTLEHFQRYALVLNQLGNSRDTLAALQRLRKGDDTPKPLEWVILAEMMQTNPEQALRQFEAMSNETTETAFYQVMAQALLDGNKFVALLQNLDQAAKAAHGPLDTRQGQAVDRYRAFVEALKVTKLKAEFLTWWSKTTDLHEELSELLEFFCERAGRTDLVEATLKERVTRTNSEDAEKALYFHYTQHRKWTEALGVCERAFLKQNRQPGNRFIVWSYYRALPLLELGRGPEALGALVIAENDTNSPLSIQLERAHFQILLDRPDDALQIIEKIIASNPETGLLRQAKLRQAEAHNAKRNFARADAIFENLLDADPDDVLVLNNFAYNLADQGRRLEEAEDMLRRAVEEDEYEQRRAGKAETARGTYLDSLGWVLFRRGKLQEAKTVFEKARQASDSANDAVVWDHAGDVHFRLKEYDAARIAWKRALILYEGTHQGRQNQRRETVETKLSQIP